MCEWGNTVQVWLLVPAHLAWEGKATAKPKDVDECIAPIVEALNLAGVPTIASCCGHGHRPGNIALADGRELIITKNFDEARHIDDMFPVTIGGEMKRAFVP